MFETELQLNATQVVNSFDCLFAEVIAETQIIVIYFENKPKSFDVYSTCGLVWGECKSFCKRLHRP